MRGEDNNTARAQHAAAALPRNSGSGRVQAARPSSLVLHVLTVELECPQV